MNSSIKIALVVVFFACSQVLAAETKSSLNSPAKITQQAAAKIALVEVPNGKLKSSELERENGRLVWTFHITMPGSANIAEIKVDAKNGALVSSTIETPADQANELAAERLKKKKTKKK
jgi:hypothetical protein